VSRGATPHTTSTRPLLRAGQRAEVDGLALTG
jgi:hypothetical protein